MHSRKVAITGAGFVSALGRNADENWSNVISSKTGIAHYPKEGVADSFQYMAKVSDYNIPENIHPKQLSQMKFLNRGALLGFSSCIEAVSSSLETIAAIQPGRRALYVAAGDFSQVGYDFMYPAIKDSADKNWETADFEKLNISMLNKVNPFFLLESLNNNLFSFLSAYIEFMGPNTSLATLSPCGGNAIELAYRSIRQNKADIALAVGYGNWIDEIPVYELEGLGILSRCRHGAQSFRPFDRSRDGFIPGEGGAALLLEDYESAKRNRREILGIIRGTGNCAEFSHDHKFEVPSTVTKRCIQSVLEDAECSISDLGIIIPHGSGTRKGDRSEMMSIADVLDNKLKEVPVCGLKPYTGHLGAASDIAEVITGIKAVKNKAVPATLNFHETEKEFSDLMISGTPQPCTKNHFLSISYGIGGQSSSVVVEVL